MPRFARRRLAWFLFACAALVGLAVVPLSRDDWNWARPLVERLASSLVGRTVRIDGDLRVRVRRLVRVRVEGVSVSNPAWAESETMARARRLAFVFDPLDWLRGRWEVDEIDVARLSIALERRADGEASWILGGERGASRRFPSRLRATEVQLTVRDARRPAGFDLRVPVLELKRRGWVHILSARAIYQGSPLDCALAVLGPPDLRDEPRLAALRLRSDALRLEARGRLGRDDDSPVLDVRAAVAGAGLDQLWRLAGLPLPRTPPFRLVTRLSWRDRRVELAGLRATIGRTDLAGRLGIELPRGERMRLDADLDSARVDLDDLEGFWGKPPREEGERETPAPGSPASVFPDLPLHFSKLRAADARIRFHARSVLGRTVLDDLALEATLRNGLLVLHPLRLGTSAGSVEARARIDASGPVTRLDAEVVVRGVELAKLLTRLEVSESGAGTLGGRGDFRAAGNSLHELARGLAGEIGVVLQNGRISDPLLELAALHLGDYLRVKLSDDDGEAPVRCLVGLFEAERGVLAARTLLLDTRHVRIEGSGSIDLGRERVDLELRPRSKNFTIGTLRTPILIEGPFATRRAKLAPGPLAVRGGAAVALGAAIHPLAALIALVDPGSKEKPGACADALADYRTIADGPARQPEAVP